MVNTAIGFEDSIFLQQSAIHGLVLQYHCNKLSHAQSMLKCIAWSISKDLPRSDHLQSLGCLRKARVSRCL